MSEDTPSPMPTDGGLEASVERITEHVSCPICGYDWYLSEKGVCLECGLPNHEPLFSQYLEGRRPAPLEFPPHRWWLAAVVTTTIGQAMVSTMVRGYDSTEARKLTRIMFPVTICSYVLITFFYNAIWSANDENLPYSYTASMGEELQRPGADHWIAACIKAPMYLLGIVPTLVLVRRRCLKRLQLIGRLSEDEAQRVFGFASPRLMLLLLSYHAASLVRLGVWWLWIELSGPPLFGGEAPVIMGLLAWALIIGIGFSGWKKSVRHGVRSLSQADTYENRDRLGKLVVNRTTGDALMMMLVFHSIAFVLIMILFRAFGALELWRRFAF